jgi:uncharacterized protein
MSEWRRSERFRTFNNAIKFKQNLLSIKNRNGGGGSYMSRRGYHGIPPIIGFPLGGGSDSGSSGDSGGGSFGGFGGGSFGGGGAGGSW